MQAAGNRHEVSAQSMAMKRLIARVSANLPPDRYVVSGDGVSRVVWLLVFALIAPAAHWAFRGALACGAFVAVEEPDDEDPEDNPAPMACDVIDLRQRRAA